MVQLEKPSERNGVDCAVKLLNSKTALPTLDNRQVGEQVMFISIKEQHMQT
jgi:hypothetical protein